METTITNDKKTLGAKDLKIGKRYLFQKRKSPNNDDGFFTGMQKKFPEVTEIVVEERTENYIRVKYGWMTIAEFDATYHFLEQLPDKE